MDGVFDVAGGGQGEGSVPKLEVTRREPQDHAEMSLTRLEDLGALVVTKSQAGFSHSGVVWLRNLLVQAAEGRLGPLKFLVLDFAHGGLETPAAGEGFEPMIAEVADLILQAPIVTIAHCRAHMAGADLEFALACSVMLAEGRTGFWFGAQLELEASLTTYAFLAQKIGFVRAERLLEGEETIDAQQMYELLLIKAVIPEGLGVEGVRHYLRPAARRHNSSYGIYRARRLATPAFRASRPAA